ncbi:Putative peptidoglycan binding domain-containing protein [Streptosporangium canum]|uniref:Putative peptidoglycan binding domain-containing protein n=2 Tax=Streptosporangium canum TaxID=324952 RepID=A0A1I3S1D5_9ACTN|nr:Putative peptidoglycan binding domain-containing protein [Streptosporangium canum]
MSDMAFLGCRGIHRHVIKYLAGTVVVAVGLLGLPAPASAKGRTLHPGDYAKIVERLQRRLQELNFSPGLVNGYYGAETQVAVWAFQKSQGLMAKDEVGPETWRALAHPHWAPPLVPAGGPRRVEIDLRRQLLTVYRHNRPMLISHVSTGSGTYFCQYGNSSSTLTPAGDFHIVQRERHRAEDPLATMYETLSFVRDPAGFTSAVRSGLTSGFTGGLKHGPGGGVVGAGARRGGDRALPDRPAVNPVRAPGAERPDRPVLSMKSARPVRFARQDHPDRPLQPDHPLHPLYRSAPFDQVRPVSPTSPVLPTPLPPAPSVSPTPPPRPVSGCARIPEHIAERLFHMVGVGDTVHVRRKG